MVMQRLAKPWSLNAARGFKSRTLRHGSSPTIMTENLIQKHLEKVDIPTELLKDILYINYLIVRKDFAAVVESDDGIQTNTLCAGLWDKKKKLFGMTFYPKGNTGEHTWSIKLTRKGIFAISKGKIDHLELWKCDNPDCYHYYYDKDLHCNFCNPIDTTFKSQYSPEDVEKMHVEKLKMLEKWKEQSN